MMSESRLLSICRQLAWPLSIAIWKDKQASRFRWAEDRAVAGEIGRWRRRCVHLLLVVIVGGSLFDIVADTEHWPFSNYAMFSNVRRKSPISVLRLYGVTTNENQELALTDFQYLQPLDRSRLRVALLSMLKRTDREELLRQVAEATLRRYAILRHQGAHKGPALHGIRVYRQTFQRDPWARNASRPDKTELLYELLRPTEEAQ